MIVTSKITPFSSSNTKSISQDLREFDSREDLINYNKIIQDEEAHFAPFEPIRVLCEINGYSVPAIIDTGAQITVMSESCAKRCRLSSFIDTRYFGRAVGVGSSEILGRISDLNMQIGPIKLESKVSVLRDSRIDLLIGLDILKRFKCNLCLSENILKLRINDKSIRVPLMQSRQGSPSSKAISSEKVSKNVEKECLFSQEMQNEDSGDALYEDDEPISMAGY